MKIACLFDIHGNLTALKAVLQDLEQVSPDLIFHGGDLADAGSSPAEVVDLVRSHGWAGVMGNTDQMLIEPASLEAFRATSQAPARLWEVIAEGAAHTRSQLGPERLAWLRALPLTVRSGDVSLVHASPNDCWRAPSAEATNDQLRQTYAALATPIVVFGHTHQPRIWRLEGTPRTIVNAGSVGLPYDGDPRACYLLLTDGQPAIRRVAYDVDAELELLRRSRSPLAEWTGRMLRTATPQRA